jgi:choline kinase
MKMIVLAAGMGSRLRPYTNDVPKCMVPLKGRPLIDYIFQNCIDLEVADISVVTGYKAEKIQNANIKKYHNEDYDSSNMVYSLMCAAKELAGDVIISYSDIVYKSDVLKKLIDSESEISVVADRKWKELWEKRMDNPLEDAETFKVDANGNIKELGKVPNSYDEIEAQYIGLIKIKSSIIPKVISFYESLEEIHLCLMVKIKKICI